MTGNGVARYGRPKVRSLLQATGMVNDRLVTCFRHK